MGKYYTFSINGELLNFNAVKYIRDYDKNERVLENLKIQLAEISEIKGQGNSPKVQTSPQPDGLENVSLLRIYLKSKIMEYESYLKTYHRAIESLDSEEKDVLETMYRGHCSHPVTDICRRYHIEQAQVYRRKNKAIEKFSEFVVGRIV